MTLLPGIRLVVAPHFHLDLDWPSRLSVGTGFEQTPEGLAVHSLWQPVSEEELSLLVVDLSQPLAREELAGCLCLFNVPGHLRTSFWEMLAQAPQPGEISATGFDAFSEEVAKFLAFKQLAVPQGAGFDLVVKLAEPTILLTAPSVWGIINLGEEPTFLVWLNLRSNEITTPAYRPVRLELSPGQGVRIPEGMLWGIGGQDREQPDVLLMIGAN